MRALHTAATGMQAQELNVQVISNNIANMRTTGYKRQRAEFQDLLYELVRRVGTQTSEQGNILPSGIELGSGVKTVGTPRLMTQGSLVPTGKETDVAVRGEGFFPISLPDGRTAYTRDGSFHSDAQGQLVTSSGFHVQPAITLPANSLTVTIARDGTISVTKAGSPAPTTAGQLQLVNFVNPAGLQSMGENMYIETAASGTANANTPGSNGLGLINQGYVETSNVNVVEELVSMIQTQRAYEINSKAIQTSDQMLQRLSQM